jgi:hypothetical protein
MESNRVFKVGTVCYLNSDLKKMSPMTVTEIDNNLIHVVWRDKTSRHLYFAYDKEILQIAD